MNEELDLLKDVVLRLEKAGIEYMLTGSMAMAAYSTPRMTRDIDIIIQVSLRDAGRIVALFRDDFYIDESSVREAIRNRGMFNIIQSVLAVKVDFIIRKDEPYRIEEFSRSKKIEIGGNQVSVVSLEDLVLSKLVWVKHSESELQFRDVKQLIKASKGIDKNYLEKWAKILGVEDLLKKVEKYE
jgi:predicted nucleotidyltransferase